MEQLKLTDRQAQYLAESQARFNEAQMFARQAQEELSRIIDLILDANDLPSSTVVGSLNVDKRYLEIEVSENDEVSK